MNNLQSYFTAILDFTNTTIIPLLFAVALLFFLVNVARFFIVSADDEDSRENARVLALYGIGAFVFLVSIWGIVNLLVSSLGFTERATLCPDYLPSDCNSPISQEESIPTFAESPRSEPVSNPNQPELGVEISEPPQSTQTPEIPEAPSEPGEVEGVPGAEATEALLSFEESIRSNRDSYLEQIAGIFKNDASYLIEAGLFADLTSTERNNDYSNLERLRAAYRLNQLDVLGMNTLNNYLESVNRYRQETMQRDTIDMSEVRNITISESDYPEGFSSNHENNAQEIRAELESYNDRVSAVPDARLSESGINSFVTSTTNLRIPVSDRVERFEALMGNNPNNTIYIEDRNGYLYESFLANINAEILLKGENLQSMF